jgi:hypothetical protein
VPAHGERKKRKSEQASEKKQACMHVKNPMEERKIENKLESLYTHVLVQRERHYRYIGGVLKNHYSQDKFLSNLFAHLFPVFFYSFSI